MIVITVNSILVVILLLHHEATSWWCSKHHHEVGHSAILLTFSRNFSCARYIYTNFTCDKNVTVEGCSISCSTRLNICKNVGYPFRSTICWTIISLEGFMSCGPILSHIYLITWHIGTEDVFLNCVCDFVCDLALRTYVTIFIFVEFTKISFQRSH